MELALKRSGHPDASEALRAILDAYRLHPKAIKALARCGQGYLLSDDGLAPVAYGMLPALTTNYPLERKDQKGAKGLRLYETFVAR